MKQSSLNSSLPQIHGTKSLCSSIEGKQRNSQIRRRRSSIHTAASEMGRIKEDHNDIEVPKLSQTSQLKMPVCKPSKVTTRRNSIATLTASDSSKNIPVMIRNNHVRLRKYSCPERFSSGNASSQEIKQKVSGPGPQASGSNKGFYGNYDNDEAKVSQAKKQVKHDGEQDKQVIDIRNQESKSKTTNDSLPKLNPESKEDLQGRASAIKCSNDSQTLEERSIVSESTDSLYSDSHTFHEEIVSLLSYSGNVRKMDGLITPTPSTNRGRSSIIVWLKEINSYQ